MMYGSDNSCFGTIKTDLENKMTCGLDSYPKSKDETVGLINNYHVIKKLARVTPVKEYAAFAQTISNTKTSKKKKKGKPECFHCGDPKNWAYEFPQLSDKERDELSATKEKGGCAHAQDI